MSINTPRKSPHCSYCKNHDEMKITKQHQCQYKMRCQCILCQLTKKAQVIMCHQQRVWRHNNSKHLNETANKGQKCDNCRNHLIFVRKSNHACPFKNCECNYCKLTYKRREIMKHIQRARRLNVVIKNPNLQDGDPSEEDKTSVTEELKSLSNDKDIDILMKATGSTDMELLTPPASMSPMQIDQDSATKPSLSPSSHSLYKGNDSQSLFGKDSKETVKPFNHNLPLSPTESSSSSSSSSTRERPYSDPYRPRTKFRGYDEHPLSRGFPFTPFSSSFPFENQESSSSPHDDVKPVFYETPPRTPLNLSTDTRSSVGPSDSRNLPIDFHCPRIPTTLPSPLVQINQFIPYPSFELGSSSTLPLFYNQYISSNRTQGRPIRPEPVNPTRSNVSSFYPFLTRASQIGLQEPNPNPLLESRYPTYPHFDLLRVLQLRNQLPYHVKVPSE